MNKKVIGLLLVCMLLTSSLTGCGLISKNKDKDQSKEVSKVENKETNISEESDKDNKPTTWQLDEEVSTEAAKILAEKENIPIDKEELLKMYRDNYANGEAPTTKADLQYSLNAIEKIVGENNIVIKILPQYVVSKVKEKREKDLDNISEEKLESLLKEYKDYMDTMGIVDSARKEYVKNLYLKTDLELEVDGIYQNCYEEALYKVYSKYNPEYIKSLKLEDSNE